MESGIKDLYSLNPWEELLNYSSEKCKTHTWLCFYCLHLRLLGISKKIKWKKKKKEVDGGGASSADRVLWSCLEWCEVAEDVEGV